MLALGGVGMSSTTKIKGWTLEAVWKKSKDGVGFFLTRTPNPWRPESESPSVRFPKQRAAILFFLVLVMSGGFVVWVCYCTYGHISRRKVSCSPAPIYRRSGWYEAEHTDSGK